MRWLGASFNLSSIRYYLSLVVHAQVIDLEYSYSLSFSIAFLPNPLYYLNKNASERGFQTFEVEILDQARINVLSVFTVAPNHAVISSYESSRPCLIES